jgi:5-methyltetrahydrofolate--homocysteine methyltransferase
MTNILEELANSLYDGRAKAVTELTRRALDGGLPPGEVLAAGLIAGMDRVGADFRTGILYVPEVLACARAMHAGLDVLRPLLAEGSSSSAGKVVLGTVAGDLHDIGKNLVAIMMEGAGFQVVDAGIDVSPTRFVELAQAEQPDLIGLSALLTTTMTAMKQTVDALLEAGIRDRVKVMIGGAPVTDTYAQQIGADGYAADAGEAVELARRLMGA